MAKHAKLDLYKKFKSEYVTPQNPIFVVIGPAKYLAISGTGAPGSERFQSCISALYAVAFTLKMAEKTTGHDYKVCHLEGLWWTDDGNFEGHTPEDWRWKLLIRVPEFISEREVQPAIKSVMAKGKAPRAAEVKLDLLSEDRCVQVLHVGPYAAEQSTIVKMQETAAKAGLNLRGPHHEIYLSDPRRVPEQRLRTILRNHVQ
jgi:hypothetical protein